MAETAFTRLQRALADVIDLRGAAALLTWDQATYMPPGGATARARQLALLQGLAHERLVAPEVARLIDAAAAEVEADGLAHDSFEAAYLRVARRDVERAAALPADFARRFHAHIAHSYQAWTEARPADDVERVLPLLETTLDLSRELAEHLGPAEHVADPLIARSDHGFTVALLRPLFASLRSALVPLLERVRACDPPADGFLRRHYPLAEQFAFALARVREFGYDTSRGRLDPTHHPFAIEFGIDDVRITTRGREDDLREALFCTFHESGHGMYHQGLDPRLEATPLADGTSAGVHESQSRTWENRVGRGLAFWTYAFPKLREAFPEQLAGASLEAFHRAVNVVQPGVIRTEADELSYDLHVIVRFELELELLEGRLSVRDLPEAWHARYEEVLGRRSADHRDGVLQDVHWFAGPIGGAFQGYTLGNVLAAQFWAAAEREVHDLEGALARGEFTPLTRWQRERIHRHGRALDPLELIETVCGGPLDAAPYLAYLETKYGALYPGPA
jgi:carboxypeptidase Taq